MLWQHLFWLFGHPEVYIMALPAFGIISEVIPTFSRKPLFGYPMMAYSICLIAFLSYGVWGHHMFATGMGPVADSAFAITSMLIAIPTGVKIFSWIATVWGGSLRYDDRILFRARVDPRIHDRRPQRDHARVSAGRPPADRLVLRRRAFSLRAVRRRDVRDPVGVLLLVAEDQRPHDGRDARQVAFLAYGRRLQRDIFPDAFSWDVGHAAAHLHLRRRHGLDASQPVSRRLARFILGIAFLLFYINIFKSIASGERAPADPWDGRSLEWSTPSPPPAYNFATIPQIRGRDAWWILKYGRAGSRGVAAYMSGQAPSQPQRVSPRSSSTSTCRRRRSTRWC